MARKKSARAYRQTAQQNIAPFALLFVGCLLLFGGLIYSYWTGQESANSAFEFEYNAEDVASTRPILAIHEMGEGPAIPFLPKNQPQPKIVVPEATYNFGTIGPSDTVEQTFIVQNEGDAALTISRAYTTCGCTTAEISASIIPPGKVALVKLIYDAGFHDTTGQTVRRGLILENNDPLQSQAEIWVEASVRNS